MSLKTIIKKPLTGNLTQMNKIGNLLVTFPEGFKLAQLFIFYIFV